MSGCEAVKFEGRYFGDREGYRSGQSANYRERCLLNVAKGSAKHVSDSLCAERIDSCFGHEAFLAGEMSENRHTLTLARQ